MPRISPAAFLALPLRVNTLLADVPLHDVWAVDLPGLREGVTLENVLRRSGRDVFGSRDARAGNFRVVYRFENEQLLEVHNRTVHAAALSALEKTADGYRYYFAVYVVRVGWITPLYMALIDPFRRWIIYPALLKNIRNPAAPCKRP